MMKLRPHAITIAIGILLSGQPAFADETEQGKRIDNGRVDVRSAAAPMELQPAIPYPLPSGVTREEVRAMRERAQVPPPSPASVTRSLQDAKGASLFASGKADLTPAAKASLDALAAEIRQHGSITGGRIAIAGHTDNQRLSPNARRLFRDNQGLSEARALQVATYLKNKLGDLPLEYAIEGFGETRPVASNRTPEGMARNRRVELQVWFEVATPSPVVALPEAREDIPACSPSLATVSDLPFQITVDGVPVDLPGAPVEADNQRCTDVALEKADIQVRYDSLAAEPLMNIWATPAEVVKGQQTEFLAWSNYLPWIKKAEIRLFRDGQRPDETPLQVLPISWQDATRWTVPADMADDKVFYLLRVYDAEGRFDETSLKSLNLLARPLAKHEDRDRAERERLTGYGENSLALRNIPVRGGTVTVNGSGLQSGQRVSALGLELPVDANGRFAIKQIMSAGPHSVEVTVRETDGRATTFRRNLNIAADDWFYVAVGDLTVGRNAVTGPAQLLNADNDSYDGKVYVHGRTAFYLKGKIKGDWLLTASADTREQPLRDLFSNFSSKDPRYLLRNIDPNQYYPVYGDDSTVVDDAPTQGRFYVRLQKQDTEVMWGNFQTTWTGTELMQYSRGLYGARLRHRSESATAFGERQTQIDLFAADPGTLGAREEFRGTGGSLYYLRNLDITQGSERVWIEVRDQDSGLVLERRELTPGQDYEINYLQGRLLLQSPLSMTTASSGLIATSALSGNALYLVTTYEYAPGLSAVDNVTTGIRASQWINDHFQVGLSTYRQGGDGVSQTLKGIDATLRYKPGTYLRLETARSDGTGIDTQTSITGGLGFDSLGAGGSQRADANRVEAAVDLADVSETMQGKLSAYWQDRDAGYSAPGQIALSGEAVRQHGAAADIEVRDGTRVQLKADERQGDLHDARNVEVAVRQRVHDEWDVAVGVRNDERNVTTSNASPLLSESGSRTDAQVRLDYLPGREATDPDEKSAWKAYGFAQGTLERDASRSANNRVGVGGEVQLSERIKLLGEASDGSLGAGGHLGLDYRISDRSNAYLNYLVETESPNLAYRGRQGSLVSGASTRVSDQLRIFGEGRTTHGAGPQSLTQAFGLDWAPNDRWTYGAKLEFGTVSDPLSGDLRRRAVGGSLAYREGGLRYGGQLEFRRDEGTVVGRGTTWLMRNTLGWQLDESWRLLGKFNLARNSNSNGQFIDGDYTEFVIGGAYRPVDNDRWNTLLKYTLLNNVPSSGQLAPSRAAADYAQRSQVVSVDTVYDVNPWLSVGGKYALRVGELKSPVAGGEWFSSRAQLWILRADVHFVKEWDALLELRKLDAKEAQDARAGALIGVYRHFGKGIKAGVGYNFTNYSDDLTDLSYRSRGWFLNVLATY